MRSHPIWLVARKELLEALRDRRTLFVALILPVLLYPLMMMGMGPLISMQRKRLRDAEQKIAITGGGAAALEAAVLDAPAPPPEPGVSQAAAPSPASTLLVISPEDPEAALREGKITLWIEAPEDFAEQVAAEGTGEVVVHRDGSDDKSLTAYRKWKELFGIAKERLLAERLERAGFDERWRRPIEITEVIDVASAERRGAYVFGKVLSLLLVLMTISSSFYPAVDMVAGEKERGTMETLLVAPCGRTDLVLGKFLAVLAVTIAAAVLNLASMGLTMGPMVGALPIPGLTGLSVTPRVLLGILLLLLPLAALFSAVAIALSTLARSVKEAQHYMTPLFLVVMPLSMVVVLPDIPLTPVLAAVPVTNAVLFFRDLMLDKVDVTITLIVLSTTVAAAGLALWASVLLFLREESLFRGPEGTDTLIARPRPRSVPGVASAVFLFAGSLALVWYLQGALPKEGLSQILSTQLLLILMPCAALAWWLRADPRATFLLRAPRVNGLLLAVPIGLAAPVVNAALQQWIGTQPAADGPFAETAKQLEELIRTAHAGELVLFFGLIPALCEEAVYRGFILSGLGGASPRRATVVRAVLISAAFFALFHIFPEKWGPTFLMGLTLAFVAVKTGSLWPGVIVHALNNSALVLVGRDMGDPENPLAVFLDPEAEGHGGAVLGAVAVLAVSLWAMSRLRPLPSPGAASKPPAAAETPNSGGAGT